MSVILFFTILVGFKTEAYRTLRVLIFIVATLVPARHPSAAMVLVTPTAIIFSNIQLLIQTQSVNTMLAHLMLQAFGFYFYGMERMATKIKEMTAEELAESAKLAIMYTFAVCFLNLISMKIFYSQFSSLLRKVNTLKDNLAKANSQLNDQNLKLQNNLEMKDVFIYTFSHELKNALNGLLGNLGLAHDSAKADPRVLQYLSSAKVCGEVLKNFIHNILDSGKLENGNLEVSPERKDVMHLLQNIWTICGRIIQNKRLEGYLEIEKNVPRYLEIDEQRAIQIILNLVSNAVKFTEKGHVRIRIRWQTTSSSEAHLNEECNMEKSMNNQEEEEGATLFGDIREFPGILEASPALKNNHHLVTEYQKKFIAGSQFYQLNLAKWQWEHNESLPSLLPEGSKGILKIQVLDSGCGMTTEEQSKLFQKFSQVSSIQGQRKIGTGLGLWICKELANRLDGDITTRSAVAVGSVFELMIRTKVSQNRKKGHRRNVTPTRINDLYSPSKIFSHGGSNTMKVLIADDDSFNIELLKNYLNKFGINYLCAHDGEEAVSLFKKHHKEICIVITDNFMPKKTGTEAALEIAEFLEEKQFPKIPILCISGDLKVSVGDRGITCVIQKPINFDRLKEELMMVYPQLTQFTDGGDK